MAEDIRAADTEEPDRRLGASALDELIAECERQEESCLFTSTSLYMWLRNARFTQRVFIGAPIVLGGIATWSVLDQPDVPWLQWLTASFALLAGLFPAIYQALKLDTHIAGIARQAAEFKNLQDRFRQCRTLGPTGPIEEFRLRFEGLMARMEDARGQSITPPEKYFLRARRKIESGHYSFRVDEAECPSHSGR